MTPNTQPATSFKKLTDFSSDVSGTWRRIYCVGGTKVVFEDNAGNETTILAADYAAINNQPTSIVRIDATTDCTSIYVSE